MCDSHIGNRTQYKNKVFPVSFVEQCVEQGAIVAVFSFCFRRTDYGEHLCLIVSSLGKSVSYFF